MTNEELMHAAKYPLRYGSIIKLIDTTHDGNYWRTYHIDIHNQLCIIDMLNGSVLRLMHKVHSKPPQAQ